MFNRSHPFLLGSTAVRSEQAEPVKRPKKRVLSPEQNMNYPLPEGAVKRVKVSAETQADIYSYKDDKRSNATIVFTKDEDEANDLVASLKEG